MQIFSPNSPESTNDLMISIIVVFLLAKILQRILPQPPKKNYGPLLITLCWLVYVTIESSTP
jgi:hypothetical protein